MAFQTNGRKIDEEFAEMARKISAHTEEVAQIGKCLPKKRKRCSGSAIEAEEKKNGKTKNFSLLEKEIYLVFKEAEQMDQESSKVITWTDMILQTIIDWPKVSRILVDEHIIPQEMAVVGKDDSERFTVTWLMEALKIRYPKLLEQKLHKLLSSICYVDMKNNIPSLFSQIFAALDLLGLATKSHEWIGQKTSHVYRFSGKVHCYNLAQLKFLVNKGSGLSRRIKKGGSERQKIAFRKDVRKKNGTQTITIPLDHDIPVKKLQTIMEKGKLIIKIKY